MIFAECIQPTHLQRLAVVYIRQSTPQQPIANKESLELQYKLRDHAQAYGWHPNQIRVIDTDLGHSGRSADRRPGFQELVTLVDQRQVGLLVALDATRLARNCTDWYQLLDLCSYRHCLVADQDSVYDPATPQGRLFLGLKGLMAEAELDTLRRRLQAGLRNKAQRGDLAQLLPVGLVRTPCGEVIKRPDQEVQSRLDLLFATFLQLGSAAQVVRFCHDHDLRIPRRGGDGAVVWRHATPGALAAILHNPAYAGAYVRGRTRAVALERCRHRPWQQRLPQAEWDICLQDRYPAYIDWATFEKIQAMLHENHSDYGCQPTRGVPRGGQALLHGLLYCGACGHKLVVRYKKGPTYICNYFRQRHEGTLCQQLPAAPLDAQVVEALLEALAPVEWDVYAQAVAARQQQAAQVAQAQQHQLERLRYQARLAERQFCQVDPDNRLVAAALEKRWETALQEMQEAECKLAGVLPPVADPLPADLRSAFLQAGQMLPLLWRQDLLTPQRQKALLRCLIDKVVAHRSAPDIMQTRIVWKGGATTTAALPLKVGALARLSCAAAMEQAIRDLTRQGQSDATIAQHLTAAGYRSPRHATVLPSTVQRIRRRQHHVEAPPSPAQEIPGGPTVAQRADPVQVEPHGSDERIGNGTVEVALDGPHPGSLFPDQPQTVTMFRQPQAGELHELRY